MLAGEDRDPRALVGVGELPAELEALGHLASAAAISGRAGGSPRRSQPRRMKNRPVSRSACWSASRMLPPLRKTNSDERGDQARAVAAADEQGRGRRRTAVTLRPPWPPPPWAARRGARARPQPARAARGTVVVPAEAGVGDALAVDQRLAAARRSWRPSTRWLSIITPKIARVAGGDLAGDVARHARLARWILAAVAVAAVDHHARRQPPPGAAHRRASRRCRRRSSGRCCRRAG